MTGRKCSIQIAVFACAVEEAVVQHASIFQKLHDRLTLVRSGGLCSHQH